tara:strand:- start:9544 stop:10041 length:498 start_codon:yes stop_codon:yes gene_type:complete
MDAGVSITVDLSEFDAELARLGPVIEPDMEELVASIGALGESQTRRRISDEKTAPDGTPWKENRTGTPILHQTGRNLLDSVAFVSDADSAEWGATWEFAHVHQDGAVIEPRTAKMLRFKGPNGVIFAKKVTIPARPFVGLSDANREEISDLVTDFFGDLIRERAR